MQTQIADDWFVGFNTGLKARFWRAASEPWADEDAQAIAALLDLPAGARVLDAPSGAGRIAVRLAERGLDVVGIDISQEEIEEARRVAAERGASARFEQGDLRELPEQRLRCRRVLGQQLRLPAPRRNRRAPRLDAAGPAPRGQARAGEHDGGRVAAA